MTPAAALLDQLRERGVSHATAARDRLRARAQEMYLLMRSSATSYGVIHARLATASDLIEVMQALVSQILAVETMAEHATQAAKALRAILSEVMDETGGTKIATEHHLAYLSRSPEYVSVEHEDAIPREYWVQPPARPDLRAVIDALRKGLEIPGCTIIKPNSMRLNIRTKKEGVPP